jgi:hypothetical protein
MESNSPKASDFFRTQQPGKENQASSLEAPPAASPKHAGNDEIQMRLLESFDAGDPLIQSGETKFDIWGSRPLAILSM